MRKKIILLCSALILTLFSFSIIAQEAQAQTQEQAQEQAEETEAQMDLERFEQRMMEYVKRVARLTQEEADKYFPLNRELTRKKLELHRNHREKVEQMQEENATLTDEEYLKILESEIELRQQQAALDVQFNEKFLEFLSPQRLYAAQRAERTFMIRELAYFREQQENQEQEQKDGDVTE